MNFGPRLDLRQSQSLVMTPQLQQAIKLLALSNLEIETFISDALEANPLLEMGEAQDGSDAEIEPSETGLGNNSARDDENNAPVAEDGTATDIDNLFGRDGGSSAGDQPLDIDPATLDRDHDTGEGRSAELGSNLHHTGPGAGSGEQLSIDERGNGPETLADHLLAQIGPEARDPHMATIARYLVSQLDEAGYLAMELRHVAGDLDVPLGDTEAALALVQSLDPTGVGARNLGECLALQAKDADRYDPCMARLIDNLDLLGKGNLKQLKRICEVNDEDFADMLSELRHYDPKPGLKFSNEQSSAAVVPDILIRTKPDEGWDITLNPATLPRLIVNRSYYLELAESCDDKASRSWLNEKLADANWLMRALDQRQKTILKVAAEIIRFQADFFRRGVAGLKPLTLREVAEAIEMHESTVSRVTANKYLNCDRGTFELKFFFTSGVASSEGGSAVSAETVKAQIRALIDAEPADAILSDDALVDLLKNKGFDLARRTVAKYREAIGIGSSVQRRRQKALAAVR